MAKRKVPAKRIETPFEKATAFLKRRKVEFLQGNEYVGEPGVDRHVEDRPYIEKIKIPFTGDEWIDLMDTEGQALGMCCATISHARDILLAELRGGRWINGEKLWEFVELLRHHDSFEYMLPPTEKNYQKWKSHTFKRPKDDPVYRLWEIYDAIKDHLIVRPPPVEPFSEDAPIRQPIQAALSTVYSHSASLYWATSCFNDEGDRDPPWMKQQKQAARQLTIHRLLPALQSLLKHIDALNLGDFDGFAVCKSKEPDAVTENGLGLCVYHTRDEAQRMIDTWAKQDDENKTDYLSKEVRANTIIRPVHISSKTGLTFKD
jgi:hypothetical protein